MSASGEVTTVKANESTNPEVLKVSRNVILLSSLVKGQYDFNCLILYEYPYICPIIIIFEIKIEVCH